MEPVLGEVRERIAREGLSAKEAAKAIGVAVGSLERHLTGGYVRSDSLAKYRAWLDPRRASRPGRMEPSANDATISESVEQDRLADVRLSPTDAAPLRKHLVVDLFSGCGGMSLGFDLFKGGTVFETVLALDIERAMVDAFNQNQLVPGSEVCRRVDLSDLKSESEILAFYLDHLSNRPSHQALKQELAALPTLPLQDLKRLIGFVDHCFLQRFGTIRTHEAFAGYFRKLPNTVLRQTSVMGFFEMLGLPLSNGLQLGPLAWAQDGSGEFSDTEPLLQTVSDKPEFRKLFKGAVKESSRLWRAAYDALREKAGASGKGQLVSSAGRIRVFLEFLEQPVWARIRREWIDWRSTRDALRRYVFSDPGTCEALSAAYRGDRRVSILLGGPPCQGFSRIGRGKIRSLREHGVHVQTDAGAGDSRNRLLESYVLCVAALRPFLFLFENVRHFQAEVKTPNGTFHASDALASAIADISKSAVRYQVSNRVIDCRLHLIPQTRERFFMAGVRDDLLPECPIEDVASWCLSLPQRKPIPLRTALEGLRSPAVLSDAPATMRPLAQTTLVPIEVHGAHSEVNEYLHWVTQRPPRGPNRASQEVDAHVARPPRPDDRELFALMGPGTRWMDYRCDGSETLEKLGDLLRRAKRLVSEADRTLGSRNSLRAVVEDISTEEIDELLRRVDGSLSIRLLLEKMTPMRGELHHHLLTDSYLGKREGQHGDWLARMHPDRPAKTIVSHMGKDTYAFVHPSEARTLSVREAARVQTFPDWFSFGALGFVDAFRVIGNAVPPLLSAQLAARAAQVASAAERTGTSAKTYR